jgi:hypothetical protein
MPYKQGHNQLNVFIEDNMIDWLKQQFESWIERRAQRRECLSCNTLRDQLFIANNEKQKLLDTIVELTNPKQPVVEKQEEFKPIPGKMIPWHLKRQMLEAESRASAKIAKERAAELGEANDNLEDELLKMADDKGVGNG